MSDNPQLEEALARADALDAANHHGGDAGIIRSLAQRVRELEEKVKSKGKK